MTKLLLTLSASAAALLATVPAFADPVIVNVSAYDAKTAGNVPAPVTQTFGPGTYTVAVVGKAGGGLYDAWGVAASNVGTPSQSSDGNWDERYTFTDGTTTTQVNPYAGQRFATAADALAAFSTVLSSFTLTQATAVTFSITDYVFTDNAGGVSLGITAGSPASVPEPATIGLFGLGMLGVFAMRRRQKNAAAY